MSKKTLFIDGQVFQSAAWDRGMGKYSLALLKAMAASDRYDYDKTYIVFTKHLPLKDEARKLIKEIIPKAEHVFSELQVPANPSLANIPHLQSQNRKILNQLVDTYCQYETDDVTYLILALFIDQACSVFPERGRRVLLFYDLIPLQYNERYGLLNSYQNYLARYKAIFDADTIMTISQTVADDVALNLGIDHARIFNIDGAPIERSSDKAKKPAVRLPKRYVLMPSGDDIRKNNARAVQGFESYLQDSEDGDIALVLTSTFNEASRNTLRAYSKNIIFTGNVSEEELRWLYEHAEAMLFVPEYEGLGLPILEAAEAGKPIVCSDLSVFNEISSTAFYYSNPFDPLSIGEALGGAMHGDDFSAKSGEYKEILRKYTWPHTAAKALDAMSGPRLAPKVSKLRLAVLTPTPGGYSAIGKLVMQLHPSIKEYFDVDYYAEDGKSNNGFRRPNYLPYVAKVLPASDFNRKKYAQYDAVLYHIGNSEFHLDTIKNALYMPGYAIFHDTHLKNTFESVLLPHGYITKNRFEAERLLDKKISNQKAGYLASIVNNQQALIAHSDYTSSALAKSRLDDSAKSLKLNLPTAVPRQVRTKKPGEQLTIGLAGIIHPAKGLDIIEGIAKSSDFYDCKVHVFGLSLVAEEVIRRLQAYPKVQVDTDVTDFQFQNMLSQLDILINFRTAYRGETSLATLEAMRFGVVPVVRKIGWYEELPDAAAIKVKSQEELMVRLNELVNDPARLAEMSAAARRYIETAHSYQAYAKGLYDFIVSESADGGPGQVAEALKSGASMRTLKKLLRRSN